MRQMKIYGFQRFKRARPSLLGCRESTNTLEDQRMKMCTYTVVDMIKDVWTIQLIVMYAKETLAK